MKKLSIIHYPLSIILVFLLVGCATSEPASEPTFSPSPTATMMASAPSATPTEVSLPDPIPTNTPTQQPIDSTSTTISPLPTETIVPTPSASALVSAFYSTHQRPDGNRLVLGQGNLPDSQPLNIALAGEPTWLVAAPAANGDTIWVATLLSGQVQAFRVSRAGQAEPFEIAPGQLPPGMPPLLRMEGDTPILLLPDNPDFSPLTNPVSLSSPNRLAYIKAEGGLIIEGEDGPIQLEIDPLPDARILVDEQERLLLLTGPTADYRHAVLGDGLEAKSITLIETRPTPRVVSTILIPEPSVVEGLAPIWTDLTGDGIREIIVTLSNIEQGAQLVVFNEAGEQIAAGPAIGQGNRWRHQLAVAPFGPAGELELVDVLTPHLGRVTEFFQLNDSALEVVATVPGYTSHRLGSRNLDTALAGDLDSDRAIELLIPNAEFTELAALRRTPNGADVAWTVPVDSLIATNLAAATADDGHLTIGVGRVDWVLRVWP